MKAVIACDPKGGISYENKLPVKRVICQVYLIY